MDFMLWQGRVFAANMDGQYCPFIEEAQDPGFSLLISKTSSPVS